MAKSLLQALIIALAILLVSADDPHVEADGSAAPQAAVTTPPPTISPPIPPPTASAPASDPFTTASFLAPILLNLGFQELAMAVHSLPPSPPAWTGPSTIFAPSDASIRRCSSCSPLRLLQEHIIPGLYSLRYLRSLPFGTKIETMIPGRCATITSNPPAANANASEIFVDGVQITSPDLFNNGFLVVHGLDGFVSHLSPFSCNVERASAVAVASSFSAPPPALGGVDAAQVAVPAFSVMRLMLRDAILRLRISGYSVLALALRVKYQELVGLQNMTVFALDDTSIFNGGHAYVREVRFHIVPNRLLLAADLARLPALTVLPTLVPEESLVVTSSGTPPLQQQQPHPAEGIGASSPLRINYVRIRYPDLVHNLRIAVHGLFMPFPHLGVTPEAAAAAESLRTGLQAAGGGQEEGSCGSGSTSSGMDVRCAVAPTLGMKLKVDIEDHHGL